MRRGFFNFTEEDFWALNDNNGCRVPSPQGRTFPTAPARRYSGNIHKHFMYGDGESLPEHITKYWDKA
ncbi:MAG: hypothetical protein JRF47_10985 [Deltaproteobacteria bacterium]|nr:hypothetical protein [Deltaproteobacteria bacterium]